MKINKYGNYKSNTIKFFDKVAEKKHGDSYKHYDNVLNWIETLEVEKILDLGTGRGDFVETLLKKSPKKKYDIYGVDISENMIEKASEKKLDAKFSVGESEKLHFKDNYFDLIVCINSFHHYEKPKESIEEIERVLKNGGILILGEIYLPEFFRKTINKILPYGTTGDYKIYSSKELAHIFSERNIKLSKESYVFPSIKTYMFEKLK